VIGECKNCAGVIVSWVGQRSLLYSLTSSLEQHVNGFTYITSDVVMKLFFTLITFNSQYVLQFFLEEQDNASYSEFSIMHDKKTNQQNCQF